MACDFDKGLKSAETDLRERFSMLDFGTPGIMEVPGMPPENGKIAYARIGIIGDVGTDIVQAMVFAPFGWLSVDAMKAIPRFFTKTVILALVLPQEVVPDLTKDNLRAHHVAHVIGQIKKEIGVQACYVQVYDEDGKLTDIGAL